MPELFHRNGFTLLPIIISHILKTATLPFHHKDPFDSILISQSLVESMPLASSDIYGVERRWQIDTFRGIGK